MSIEASHEIKKAAKIILPVVGLLLGFVWSYLEKVLPIDTKQELTTIYLVQLGLTAIIILFALLAFIVFLLVWRKKEIKPEIEKAPTEKIETNNKNSLEEQFKRTIFLHILKLRGLNQVASPKSIAAQMNHDVNIVFAHLNKFHNEQYVTFQTGGLPPTVDTDFFLSPKAFEIIKLLEPPQRPRDKKPLVRPRNGWVNRWRDY
jgi:large-conductance mechanosensitive channel